MILKMNTLSIPKLQELLYQQRHRIIELFVTKTQIQYLVVLCEHYRNFFMIDLRTLPMLYDEDRVQEFIITPIHSTSLPSFDTNEVLSSFYKNTSTTIPPHFIATLQKERMENIHFHINSYLKLVYYSSSYLFHIDSIFQIEHVRYPENFGMYCISVDDYYIHQSTLSHDLFKRYEQLSQFISQNVIRQSNILMTLFKKPALFQQTLVHMNNTLEKYQRYQHLISSIFQKITLSRKFSIIPNVIEVMFLIYRHQFQYLLEMEHKFYTLTLHSSMILQSLSPS